MKPPFAALLFITFCLLLIQPLLKAETINPLVLQPGDRLDITIFNNPDLTRKNIPIAPDGKIYYLMIEPVQAAGQIITSVQKALESKLGRIIQDPQIDLTLTQRPRNQFIILGQVKFPGLYDISPGLTLSDAIALAGGLNGKQSPDNTLIDLSGGLLVHSSGKTVTLNLEQLLTQGKTGTSLLIEAGDYIHIPELAGKHVFILGQIASPQSLPYTNDLTLIKALASLEKNNFNKSKPYMDRIAIIRGSQSSPQLLHVEASKIMAGQEKDLRLLPGDIIYIPEQQIDWAELGNIALKAYTSAFATKTATSTFSAIKDLKVLSK